MKKKLLLGLLLASIFGNILTLQAKTESVNIPVKYNNIKVTVDGNQVSTANEPFIYNGTTYYLLEMLQLLQVKMYLGTMLQKQ